MAFRFPACQVFIQTGSEESKEEWRAWRESECKLYIASSQFADWFGHGYVSRRKRIQYKTGLETEPETNVFQEMAMNHGTKNERRGIMDFLLDSKLKVSPHQDITFKVPLPTHVFDVHGVKVVCTPDLILGEHGPWIPVEVKCPFHRIQKLGLENAIDEFQRKHPYGRQNAFLQAALYAMVFDAGHFYVTNYFTDEENGCSIYIKYQFTETLDTFLQSNLQQMHTCLQNQTLSNTPSSLLKETTRIMHACFEYSVKTSLDFISYETTFIELLPESHSQK